MVSPLIRTFIDRTAHCLIDPSRQFLATLKSIRPGRLTPLQGFLGITMVGLGAGGHWSPWIGCLAAGALLLIDAWRPPRISPRALLQLERQRRLRE